MDAIKTGFSHYQESTYFEPNYNFLLNLTLTKLFLSLISLHYDYNILTIMDIAMTIKAQYANFQRGRYFNRCSFRS